MAIAVTMDFAGGTLAQYDEVIERMGFARGGAGASGGLFHWVAQTEDGIRVTDVWESREQFDKFAAETIGPVTQAVGVPGPPKMTVMEIHNYLTAGSRRRRRTPLLRGVCNGHRAELADELVTDDYVSHGPQAPPAEGPGGARERVRVYQDALDGHWGVDEILSAGDGVVARWTGTGTHRGELMGIDPTDRPISVEAISVFRIADGKIAEEWTVWDALGLLQQVGAVPAPA